MMDTIRGQLDVTIASEPSLAQERYAALVSLCRLTADRLDATRERPSGQVIAAYLSALKDLDKAISNASGGTRKDVASGTLGKLRLAHGKSA